MVKLPAPVEIILSASSGQLSGRTLFEFQQVGASNFAPAILSNLRMRFRENEGSRGKSAFLTPKLRRPRTFIESVEHILSSSKDLAHTSPSFQRKEKQASSSTIVVASPAKAPSTLSIVEREVGAIYAAHGESR